MKNKFFTLLLCAIFSMQTVTVFAEEFTPETYSDITNYEVLGFICEKDNGEKEYFSVKSPTDGNKLDKLPPEQITENTTKFGEPTTETATTAANNYSKDSPSYWAQNEVSEAVGYNILPVKFQCDYTKPITREDFCELIINTLRVQNADILKYANIEGMDFTDTNNPDIKLASALGIVAGVGNNKFNPDGKITRQEAARMLYRTATISERINETEKYFDRSFIDNNKIINTPYQFDDISKFEYWSSLGIQYCYQNKIMVGVGQNIFDPTGNYTREQAYLTALRLYKNYNGESVFSDTKLYGDEEFDKVYTIYEDKMIVFNNDKFCLVDINGDYIIENIGKNIESLNRTDISVYDCNGDWLIIKEPLYSRSDGSIYDYRSSLYKADGTYLWTMPNLHFTDSGDVVSVNEADESDGDNIKKARYTLFERNKYEQDGYSTKTILVYKK